MKTGMEHEGLIYGSEDEFLSVVVPFLREGIANGEGIAVATDARNRELIGRALGNAADGVVFVLSDVLYRSPVAAISGYHQILEQFRRDGRPGVCAIGEVRYGDTAAEQESWLRYESIADHVFKDAPLRVVCPYDVRALPSRLVEHGRMTHPRLRDARGATENLGFVSPQVMLASIPERVSFEPRRPPDLRVAARDRDLAGARKSVSTALAAALPVERAEEAMVAVGEILANGLRHGDGPVSAELWTLGDAVVCRVRNDGPPVGDQFAGFQPPEPAAQRRMGLWIARNLADELALRNDARGPVVTLVFLR